MARIFLLAFFMEVINESYKKEKTRPLKTFEFTILETAIFAINNDDIRLLILHIMHYPICMERHFSRGKVVALNPPSIRQTILTHTLPRKRWHPLFWNRHFGGSRGCFLSTYLIWHYIVHYDHVLDSHNVLSFRQACYNLLRRASGVKATGFIVIYYFYDWGVHKIVLNGDQAVWSCKSFNRSKAKGIKRS